MKVLTREKNAGFTLMELLVSMGIGMAILAAVASTFMTQTKYLNAQEQVNEMQQNARAVVDIMLREIKMAGYKPNGGSVTAVAKFTSSELRVQADLDASGSINGSSNEDITYKYESVNKRILRNSVVLAENIDSFTFEYKKADGTTATSASDIRQIRITMTAKTAKPDPNYSANSGYRTYQLDGRVTPPNLNL
jgi:Tfp pilus assembly protein PilW